MQNVGQTKSATRSCEVESHRPQLTSVNRSATIEPVASDLQRAFQRDIERQLRARLGRSGVFLRADLDPFEVTVRYFDYKLRVPRLRPRQVHVSKTLADRLLPHDLAAGMDCIVDDLQSGAPLAPYFSRSWLDLESNDILFNDWFVRHMHLGGRQLEADGFVKRTGLVLFVYLTRKAAYLVDAFEHGAQHRTTFAEPEIVDIIHTSWPTLIAHARADGVKELEPNDAETRWRLSRRRHGPRLGLGVETRDGTVYNPIGGGYVTTGRSMSAVMCACSLLNIASQLASQLETALSHSQHGMRNADTLESERTEPELAIKHLEHGVEYRVVDRTAGTELCRGGRITLPDFEHQ